MKAKIDALPDQPEFEEKYSTVYNELLRQESLLDALAKPKPTDPVQWTKQNRILKGEPFSFQDRDYLVSLYRDSSHRVIIVKARQMEMTEWIVNWLLHKLLSNPHTTAIYTAPRMDQVSRFSHDRFRRAILDSPSLADEIVEAREKKLGENRDRKNPLLEWLTLLSDQRMGRLRRSQKHSSRLRSDR